jgi:hypothetical protein
MFMIRLLVVCVCLGTAISSARAERVRLISGDVLIGRVVSKSDKTLTLDHPVLGTLTLSMDKIESIDAPVLLPKARTAPTSAAAKATTSPKPAKEKATTARTFLADWDLSLALGLTSDDHNGTDTLNFNTRLAATRSRDMDRDKFQFQAFIADREGEKSREDMHGQYQHDWLNRPSPWFTYAQADYDHDDFKHYEHRLSGLGGVGYDPSLEEKPGPAFRAGLGATGEWGGPQPTDNASLFGGEVSWQLDPNNKVEVGAQAAPVFEEAISGRRYLTTAGWTTRLTQTLSFRLGMRHERDTRVPDSIARDDRRIFGSVVLKF